MILLTNALSFLLNPGGFFGLIWLIILILVFRNIWTSGGSGETNKIVWSLIVFIFPVVGVILWWLFGKK
jgi:Phospholipase_D-nuclease N-terminal